MADHRLECSPSTIRRNRAKRVKTHLAELQFKSFVKPNNLSINTNVGDHVEEHSSSSDDLSVETNSLTEPAYLDFPFYFSNSSDDSDTENNPCLADFRSDLGKWCLKYNIATTAVSDLLKLLRNFETFKALPKDGRTLLKN